MGAGLRPIAKALDTPPDPTVGAPPADSTVYWLEPSHHPNCTVIMKPYLLPVPCVTLLTSALIAVSTTIPRLSALVLRTVCRRRSTCLVLTALWVAAIAGCDLVGIDAETITTESSIVSYPEGAQPTVIAGRLAFENENDFDAFMQSIINQDDSYLESVEHEMDFSSLRTDTKRLANELELDIDKLEIVEDPFFATALNAKGEMQVADIIYKITRNWVYLVRAADAHLLSAIALRNDAHVVLERKSEAVPGIDAVAVERHTKLLSKNNEIAASDHCKAYWTTVKEARRRLKGNVWMTTYGYAYTTIGVELEYQKKSWGRWWRTRVNTISVLSYVDVTIQIVVKKSPVLITRTIHVNETYDKVKNHASQIRRILWDVSFTPIHEMTGFVDGTFYARRDDGSHRSCSAYVSR